MWAAFVQRNSPLAINTSANDLAEGVRFELTRELAPPAGFQDRCLKPLGHPSFVDTSST